MPNFTEIKETYCGRTNGRTYGRTFETHFVRSTPKSLSNNIHDSLIESYWSSSLRSDATVLADYALTTMEVTRVLSPSCLIFSHSFYPVD